MSQQCLRPAHRPVHAAAGISSRRRVHARFRGGVEMPEANSHLFLASQEAHGHDFGQLRRQAMMTSPGHVYLADLPARARAGIIFGMLAISRRGGWNDKEA